MEATVIFVEHARLQDAEAAPLVKSIKKKIQLLCDKPTALRHVRPVVVGEFQGEGSSYFF